MTISNHNPAPIQIPLPSRSETERFFRFAITGGAAAVVNVFSRFGLSHVMRFEFAVALAYLIGMVVAFLLACRFVFPTQHISLGGAFTRFASVNMLSLAQVWLVSVGLAVLLFPRIGFHWHPETTAHIVGVASPVIISYYAHKHFSFKTHAGTPAESEEITSLQDA